MAQMWEVVGESDKGGILVREGQELKSKELEGRVSTGALVQELELVGQRLHYKLIEGTGPKEGWVSLTLKDKPLVVKTDKKPAGGAADKVPCGLLFPGQGSKYVGMLKEMKDEPAV